jgi:hypothetical protein
MTEAVRIYSGRLVKAFTSFIAYFEQASCSFLSFIRQPFYKNYFQKVF